MMRLQIDNQIKRLRAGLLLSASLLVSASALPPASDGEGFKAPLVMPSGEVMQMTGRLCRPAKSGPARLVLLVHGTSPDPIRNAQREMVHCTDPLAWWFTQQGYAFATFLRPGYGTSSGVVAELNSRPVTHEQASLARAATIAAAVNAATSLPGIRAEGAVVVGVSTGGLGAVAYDALPHPRVAAIISFAGGEGGHCHGQPGAICNPLGLVTAVRHFGARAATPMLWVYTANDTWFPPALAVAMAQAFQSGGGQVELQQFPAFAAEGHTFIADPLGSAVWGPVVADYLARMGAEP